MYFTIQLWEALDPFFVTGWWWSHLAEIIWLQQQPVDVKPLDFAGSTHDFLSASSHGDIKPY